VNPTLVHMLGYSSKEELLTQNLDRDIYADASVRKSILGGYVHSDRTDISGVSWKRKDGKIILVRINGGAIRQDDGTISHYEVIVEDVTEHRRLEEQYRQAQKMEAVGLLAGGISHDFNNLLGVILGNAELLLERPGAGSQHYAEQIKEATTRAAQLTRQLLAFSRKQVLFPTVLNLNAVVGDVGGILRRLIGEDVQIEVESKGSLGSVRADRGQIEQILMNLATNARDAMPDGGKFMIRTDNAELGPADIARYPYVKPGHYVRLSVSDTGVGMSEAVRKRVFEPFFTTKPAGRGTGLGLATVYGIVKQSGGYVWVSSEPRAGCTFDIYLPRVDEKAPALITDLNPRDACPKGMETVLLLEDEEPLRQVTYTCLTSGGYNVLQAGRGDAAIDMAKCYEGRITLIISDVILPEMSGPSVVEKLQAVHPEAKVLYVSGYVDAPATQRLIADGTVLLQKPVSRENLLRKIDELLHKTRSATQSSG
jgi:two-component system, cell cycle sensor histidine kinase and response regulator CckA